MSFCFTLDIVNLEYLLLKKHCAYFQFYDFIHAEYIKVLLKQSPTLPAS